MDQWLDFDHEQFEASVAASTQQDTNFFGYLNVSVINDNTGGDSEETVITFDTGGQGGTDIEVRVENYKNAQTLTGDKVQITLYGGLEAASFFSAMKNLVACYEQRVMIGN